MTFEKFEEMDLVHLISFITGSAAGIADVGTFIQDPALPTIAHEVELAGFALLKRLLPEEWKKTEKFWEKYPETRRVP